MNLDLEREKKILEYLQSIQTRPNFYAPYDEIAELTSIDLTLTKIACSDLYQKELIAYIPHFNQQYSEGLKITTLGKEALKKEYNSEWIKQQEEEEQQEKDLKTRAVVSSESSSKWAKRNVIGAYIIGITGLIIAIFALMK